MFDYFINDFDSTSNIESLLFPSLVCKLVLKLLFFWTRFFADAVFLKTNDLFSDIILLRSIISLLIYDYFLLRYSNLSVLFTGMKILSFGIIGSLSIDFCSSYSFWIGNVKSCPPSLLIIDIIFIELYLLMLFYAN